MRNFSYNDDFTTDMSFSLYYDDELGGELIASGIGSGVYSFTFDGTIYSNRERFYSETTPLPYTLAIGW